MIKQLKISNFQSHKKSTLEFHPSVNVIVGKTDSGKSSLLRALSLGMFNKPAGIAFIQHGEDETKVSITLEDGRVITRQKGKENIYKFDGVEFKAFGSKVPVEIADALNMDEINYSSQFDSHFLLNDSAGQVAAFFNKVANFEKIDTSLMDINSSIRKLKSEVVVKQELKKGYKQSLKDFAYLKEAKKDLEKLEGLQEELDEVTDGISKVSLLLELLENITVLIAKASKLLPLEKDVELLEVQIRERKFTNERNDSLSELLFTIDDIDTKLEKYSKLVKLENLVTTISNNIASRSILHTKFKELQQILVNIQLVKESSLKGLKTISKLETKFHKEIGNVCPLCNSKLKNYE